MMDCFNFIQYIVYIFLVGFSLWFLRFLLLLLIRTFAQEQVDIAKQDRLRKQTLFNDNTVLVFKPPIENKREPYEPDEQKKETPYLLQFPSRNRIRNGTLQCFAVQFTTEEFIQEALQVDPLQLDSLRDLYIEINGTHEESVERDRLENVQLNSLTESDIEADGIEQLPSIQMEHTGQSEYRYSSVAEENVSASNYEDSRGVLDDQVAETESPNVGPVRLSTLTGLEINGALRMQHEPQVHQNTTVDDNNGALRMQHEPQVHDNVIADDNPSQPIDAGDTESSVSNFTPFMSLMSMSASPPSSYFSSISNTDSHLNSNVDDQTSLDELENKSNHISDELSSLKQENTSLKDQILCKICMEKNVSIAFLPCGHLACCEDCAPAMRKCPICREFVRGTVKTFLV